MHNSGGAISPPIIVYREGKCFSSKWTATHALITIKYSITIKLCVQSIDTEGSWQYTVTSFNTIHKDNNDRTVDIIFISFPLDHIHFLRTEYWVALHVIRVIFLIDALLLLYSVWSILLKKINLKLKLIIY